MKNIKSFLYLCIAFVAITILNFFTPGDDNLQLLAYSSLVIAPDNIRAAFSRFVEMLMKENNTQDISELGLQQTTARLLKEASNTSNSYIFNPRAANPSNTDVKNLEILLPDKAKFFAAFMRVCARKWDATKKVLDPVFTYPDKNYFIATDEALSLESLYNGFIDFKTNNNGRLVRFSNDVFRRVPAQQHEPISGNQPFLPAYGPSLEEKGFHQLIPNLILETALQNEIIVNTMGAAPAIEGGTNKNYIQVELYGWTFSGLYTGGGGCAV